MMDIARSQTALWRAVEQQASGTPAIYGGIDFASMPERFVLPTADDAVADGPFGSPELMREVIADTRLQETMAAYTLMGDPVADAYAARIPEFGFRRLVEMLGAACDGGLEAAPDAPPELAALLAVMEQTPDWIDMALVDEGARLERNQYAHLVPFAIRGAFLATFINRYSALPMALTGNLSDELAARRVHETATFFTLTVMPGALKRHGAAFRAAAMVRLMHSMVRFNVMRREGIWDADIYGVPIPQVDQMPAGQIGSMLIAFKALGEGRDTFTPNEMARIEIARYRCFLLGLPRALLGETPRQIARLMLARQSTLRDAFDDATCGALVRGTLSTELGHEPTLAGRIDSRLERSFSRAFFIRHFLQGDTEQAREMGVRYSLLDRKLALIAAGRIFGQLRLFDYLAAVPGVRDIADRHLVAKLGRLLKRYGDASFTSDANTYKGV